MFCFLGRLVFFMDVFSVHGPGTNLYGDNTYLFFSTLSTYLLLMTALAYQMFVLDREYHTSKVRYNENSQNYFKLVKHVYQWKWVVASLMVLCALVFIIDYAIEFSGDTVN